MKQRVTWILIGALISWGYYLLNSPQTLPEETTSNNESINITSNGTIVSDLAAGSLESASNKGLIIPSGYTENDQSAQDSSRRLQLSGRVTDDGDTPIEDTLVSEERYFYSARTDSDGKYKILVDMPGHLNPVLRYFHSGFQDKRIEINSEALKDKTNLTLDVVLQDDQDSISVDGWLGNNIGVGLSGIKIQITSRSSQGLDIVFHTVFSDDKGYFKLDGISSGEAYKLTVYSPPEYLFYVDEEFVVSQTSAQINITLESLDFVDIDGMIVNSNAEPIPNFEIYIRNESTGTHVRKIVSDSSGYFSLSNFPSGEVSLSTQGPEYFKINGLFFKPNEYRHLNLQVDKGDHYLSGWVSDENGTPLKGALVQLNAKTVIDGVEYSSYRVKGTDSNGNFDFNNLDGGEHLLTVEAYGFSDQEIVHQFESQAEKLLITLSP